LLQTWQGYQWAGEKNGAVTAAGPAERTDAERRVAIFIASHYRETIANDAVWNSPIALSMIKGEEKSGGSLSNALQTIRPRRKKKSPMPTPQ
jgi:hypothetical protein